MKQISNDSEKEIVIYQSDYEREFLKSFIAELKNNSAVECITIEPMIESHGKNLFSRIKINTIVFARNPESQKVPEIVERYKGELPEVASTWNLYDLNIVRDNLGNDDLELDLFIDGPDFTSSHIVYDKTGDFSSIQKAIKEGREVEPRSYTIHLDNIEDLYTETHDRKGRR